MPSLTLRNAHLERVVIQINDNKHSYASPTLLFGTIRADRNRGPILQEVAYVCRLNLVNGVGQITVTCNAMSNE